jgi:hypothetical protein
MSAPKTDVLDDTLIEGVCHTLPLTASFHSHSTFREYGQFLYKNSAGMFVTKVLTEYNDEVLTALMSRVAVNHGGLNVSCHPHSECPGFRGMRSACSTY